MLQEEHAEGLAMLIALPEAKQKRAVLKIPKTRHYNLTEAFKDNVVLDYAGGRLSRLRREAAQPMLDLGSISTLATWTKATRASKWMK